LFSDGSGPVVRWSDILFIQPRVDPLVDQLLRNIANGWLVLAVVAQEDIKDFGL
jgi:hypothetical protein